jgi:hypothetical protein
MTHNIHQLPRSSVGDDCPSSALPGPVRSGQVTLGWILFSAVWFGAGRPGGMTVGMTTTTVPQAFLESGRAACREPLPRFSLVAGGGTMTLTRCTISRTWRRSASASHARTVPPGRSRSGGRAGRRPPLRAVGARPQGRLVPTAARQSRRRGTRRRAPASGARRAGLRCRHARPGHRCVCDQVRGQQPLSCGRCSRGRRSRRPCVWTRPRAPAFSCNVRLCVAAL